MIKEIKSLIARARANEIDTSMLSLDFKTYIKEQRTISIQMPRRSGKTTAARALHKEFSSLLIVPTTAYTSFIPESVSIGNLPPHRGINFKGMKYQCFILDETAITENLYLYIYDLKSRNALTDNFLIIRLYT